MFLILSFCSIQSLASNQLKTAKELETSIVKKFHSSVFEFGGDRTKDALRQKIKSLLPPADFRNDAGYLQRFGTHLYMLSTARIDQYNNRFDLTKVSNNWLNYYNLKLQAVENFLNEIIKREKKKHAAMRVSYTFQRQLFDHWTSFKD